MNIYLKTSAGTASLKFSSSNVHRSLLKLKKKTGKKGFESRKYRVVSTLHEHLIYLYERIIDNIMTKTKHIIIIISYSKFDEVHMIVDIRVLNYYAAKIIVTHIYCHSWAVDMYVTLNFKNRVIY